MQKELVYYNGTWYSSESAVKEAKARGKADCPAGLQCSVASTPCYIIHAHQILANILVKHDEITLAFFKELARDIQRAIPEANVCATDHYISCALEDYPLSFERRGESSLGRGSFSIKCDTQADVDFWFNAAMPEGIRTKFKQYFERLTP